MHICPVGHQSTAADYCDECGRTMTVMDDPGRKDPGDGPARPPTETLICRICATEYTPDDQFCEGCGHENPPRGDTGIVVEPPPPDDEEEHGRRKDEVPPPTRTLWTVRVVPDHDYFLRVLEWDGPDAHNMHFPHEQEPWTVELTGESMRIGRRNAGTSSAPPEIPITDPGVSRRHAMLLRCGDGSWELMDLGAINGTTINSGYDRVHRDPVHLKDGDRVHIGAWTTLEIRRVDL
ncbi:FHA domain-containing protein [Embleya sp. NPDC056575]|uniref:FHA domain-containing protein n=1 Tax=unclassified Embleya TaxID=2699296 RepID=UPI0036904713